MRVHPATEAYRLMTESELTCLSEDIKANGQYDPITIARVNGTESEFLVDGRNRERACEIAGIEPQYEQRDFANEDELIAFVKSRNERRDLSKGQRAMALAFLYPDPEKGGRGKKSRNSPETGGFSLQRLSDARSVLRHSRELAEAVRDGSMSLDDALKIVREARQVIENDETQMTRLRDNAPDLSDLIDEGRMPLNEAWAAFEHRQREALEREKNLRETLIRSAEMALFTTSFANQEFIANINNRLNDEEFRRALTTRARLGTRSKEDIERGAKAFIQILNKLGENHG